MKLLMLLLVPAALQAQRRGHDDLERLTASGCSAERAAVKYLRDAGSSKINWTAKISTVNALNKLPAVSVTYTVRLPAEMQAYKITGWFVQLRKESDGDYHVVIRDLVTTKTMIVEIPDPRCVTNAHLTNLAALRASMLTVPVGTKIRVTGVLFFDFAHGQLGHADNYVELHPVTSVVRVP